MKTNSLFLSTVVTLFLVTNVSCAQDKPATPTQVGEQPELSKLESFISKKGMIIKFQDFKLAPIKGLYTSSAEAKIRKVSRGTESKYFYQIVKRGQYSSDVASIAYEDLLELIMALNTLETELVKDQALNADYLENKFISDDGFQLGYYLSDGKSTWHLTLEERGSDNTIFIKDSSTIRDAFESAKARIQSLTQ